MTQTTKELPNIRLLVLDVDGTLTDGSICMGPAGEVCKLFSVKDGLGIQMLAAAGIQVAVITGRTSEIVARRMERPGGDGSLRPGGLPGGCRPGRAGAGTVCGPRIWRKGRRARVCGGLPAAEGPVGRNCPQALWCRGEQRLNQQGKSLQ